MKKINWKNYEQFNEFEQDYISDLFNETNTEIDHTTMKLNDVSSCEELMVNENGDVYYPSEIQNQIEENGDGNNGYNMIENSEVLHYDLLCTKEDMLQAWTKEEHPELYK